MKAGARFSSLNVFQDSLYKLYKLFFVLSSDFNFQFKLSFVLSRLFEEFPVSEFARDYEEFLEDFFELIYRHCRYFGPLPFCEFYLDYLRLFRKHFSPRFGDLFSLLLWSPYGLPFYPKRVEVFLSEGDELKIRDIKAVKGSIEVVFFLSFLKRYFYNSFPTKLFYAC